jgi:GNAT superfamily N-acetyltransferase
MQTKVVIIPMTKDHLIEVAQVHCAAFKGFFLTLMGEAFLRSYYHSVLDYRESVALVALDKNARVIGIAVGFKDPNEFYRHFRRYRVRMLPAIMMGLLRRPWLLLMILRNITRLSRISRNQTRDLVELASIGALVVKQNVGSTLLKSFILKAQEFGASEISLTTDELNNSDVRLFYQRHGFVEQGRQKRGRRVLIEYSFNFY